MRTLRIKLGRGGRWAQCPFSLQTDLHLDDGNPVDYELGVRHEIAKGRKLRARLVLPAAADARQLWAEYVDSKIEKRGVWSARASLPLGEAPSMRDAKFSLRRQPQSEMIQIGMIPWLISTLKEVQPPRLVIIK